MKTLITTLAACLLIMLAIQPAIAQQSLSNGELQIEYEIPANFQMSENWLGDIQAGMGTHLTSGFVASKMADGAQMMTSEKQEGFLMLFSEEEPVKDLEDLQDALAYEVMEGTSHPIVSFRRGGNAGDPYLYDPVHRRIGGCPGTCEKNQFVHRERIRRPYLYSWSLPT